MLGTLLIITKAIKQLKSNINIHLNIIKIDTKTN